MGNFWRFHCRDLYFLKTFSSEFSYVEVWFTGQSSQPPLETEDRVNLTLH